MRIAVFGIQSTERTLLEEANERHQHDLVFLEARLDEQTASLADRFPAVCAFVNDQLSDVVLTHLAEHGTRLVALRSAGYNNVDLTAAQRLGLTVLRVPAYSPYAVAEHAVALILALNRKLHRAVARVREQNFALNGLLGFDLHGRTIGIVGTGRIGTVFATIMAGFGCRLLGHDPVENPECLKLGVRYVDLPELAGTAHIIALHCPLTPQTHHLIDSKVLQQMKPGTMLINTSRGSIIDTRAVIESLKSGRLGALGIDVYEEEESLFFRDLSESIIQDDVFARLLTFHNVIITAHQAFFTREALTAIAKTTLQNVTDFERGTVQEVNRVTADSLRG